MEPAGDLFELEIQPAVINVKHQEDDICKKRNTDDIVQLNDPNRPAILLSNLHKLRKNRHFCDAVLQISSSSSEADVHEIHVHRAILASFSPFLFDLFQRTPLPMPSSPAPSQLVYVQVPGNFDNFEVFEKIVQFAYTCSIEIERKEVRDVYRAASLLKIQPLMDFCGEYLVTNLTPENCLRVRSILTDDQAQKFVSRVDAYIKRNISEVLKSKDVSNLIHVRVELIQSTRLEMTSTNPEHLLQMVLDWLRMDWLVETEHHNADMDGLAEKVHMLYLNTDHTLHDCQDIESGDVRDSELVRDYKRLSRRLSIQAGNGLSKKSKKIIILNRSIVQENGETIVCGEQAESEEGLCDKIGKEVNIDSPRRNGGEQRPRNGGPRIGGANIPAKPRQFLYARSDSSDSSDDEETDRDYRIIATLPSCSGSHSTVGLAVLLNRLISLSVLQRLNPCTSQSSSPDAGSTPSGNSEEPSPNQKNAKVKLTNDNGVDRKDMSTPPTCYCPCHNDSTGNPLVNGDSTSIESGEQNGVRSQNCHSSEDKQKLNLEEISSNYLASGRNSIGNGESDHHEVECISTERSVRYCSLDSNAIESSTNINKSCPSSSATACQCSTYCLLPQTISGSNSSLHSSDQSFAPRPPVTSLQSMEYARCAMGVAELQGCLFVCGGYDRCECLRSVELLDPVQNRWRRLPDMLAPRARTGICSEGGCVYAIGGSDGTKELESAEMFDMSTGKWKSLPPLAVPRSHAGVCMLEHRIYVIGGWNGQRGLARVDVFDTRTQVWTQAAPLTIGRSQAGVCVHDGYIYALGGCEGWSCTSTAERYDPSTDKWVQIAGMQQVRRGCGAVTFNGKIYAIGGHDSSKSLCSVEVYDPATDSWSSAPCMTTCRANVGSAVVGDRLFAVGGFNGKNFLNSVEFLQASNANGSSLHSQNGDQEDGDLDTGGQEEWTVFVPSITTPCGSDSGCVSTSTSRESSSGISGY